MKRSATKALGRILMILLTWCLVESPLHAGGVTWSCAIFQTNLTSTGAPLDETWVFELGAFVTGFTPNSSNTANWTANWRPAQRSFYNTTFRSFGASFEMVNNAAPFGTNQFGYIWAHNCSATNGQWMLVSAPTWKWPLATGVDPPQEWSVLNATNVLLGQANGTGFHMKMAAVNNAPIPTISPTEWKSSRFNATDLADPTVSGWNADPDKDGLSNLLEYVMGRSPAFYNPWSPTPTWHTIGANKYLKLSIPRCAYQQASTTIEVSSNLQSWSSLATDVETLSSNSELLEVRDRTAVLATAKRFIRLKASVP
jgi:hypothetical protein